MTIKIDINSTLNEQNYFSEEHIVGKNRVGKNIVIKRSATDKRSGPKRSFNTSNLTFSDTEQKTKTRQGADVRSTFDLEADALPFISIGNNVYPRNVRSRIISNFNLCETLVGVSDLLNRDTYTPFRDIPKFNAEKYLTVEGDNNAFMFPKVEYTSEYNDTLHMNGIIEALDIRSYGFNSQLPVRNFYKGVLGNIQGGSNDDMYRGNNIIVDLINNRETTSAIFYIDSHGYTYEEAKLKHKVDGEVARDSGRNLIAPYDDSIQTIYDKGKYSFAYAQLGDTMNDLIYGAGVQPPYNRDSEVGTRYRSANAGFVYESTTIGNTTLGTESIAFGGFVRTNA